MYPAASTMAITSALVSTSEFLASSVAVLQVFPSSVQCVSQLSSKSAIVHGAIAAGRCTASSSASISRRFQGGASILEDAQLLLQSAMGVNRRVRRIATPQRSATARRRASSSPLLGVQVETRLDVEDPRTRRASLSTCITGRVLRRGRPDRPLSLSPVPLSL